MKMAINRGVRSDFEESEDILLYFPTARCLLIKGTSITHVFLFQSVKPRYYMNTKSARCYDGHMGTDIVGTQIGNFETDKREEQLEVFRALRRYGEVIPNATLPDKRGKNLVIDALLKSKDERYGVIYLDWKRKVGTNKIHQAERLVSETNLDGAIIVGPSFSTTAHELAKQVNLRGFGRIMLLEKDVVKGLQGYDDGNPKHAA